jgi:hypothetical protein
MLSNFALRGIQKLILEDDSDVHMNLRKALEDRHYEVVDMDADSGIHFQYYSRGHRASMQCLVCDCAILRLWSDTPLGWEYADSQFLIKVIRPVRTYKIELIDCPTMVTAPRSWTAC